MKDPIAKSLGGMVLQAARLHRFRTAQRLKELGLFPGQERVLYALMDEQAQTMGELAARLQVRPPTVSKTIARLSLQGLVERRGAQHDARVVRVALTERGRERALRMGELWASIEAEMVEKLDGKARRRFRRALKRVTRSLSDAIGGEAALLEAGDDQAEL